MFSTGSSYTLPRTTSYISPSRYYPGVSSTLSSLSSRYSSPSPARYSSYSTSSSYSLTKPASSTTSYSSSYSKPPLSTTSRWTKSSLASPAPIRKDSVGILTRTPSYSSDYRYRSSSVSSVNSRSGDDSYSSAGSVSSYSRASSRTRDVLPSRSYRDNSVTSSSLAKGPVHPTSAGDSAHNYSGSKLAGKVGLNNLGNTCFMNAVLQCLCHTRPLVEYCLRGNFTNDLNHRSSAGGGLIKAFVGLMNVLWKDNASHDATPDKLKEELQKYSPRFSGYNQQDAQELLRFLLQGLHEDINRGRSTQYSSSVGPYATESQHATDSWRRYQHTDDSKIVDLFAGQLKSTLKCLECYHCSVTYEPFWDLSLPIPENYNRITLQECFQLFTSPETLTATEKPFCERCNKKTKSAKRMVIEKFPVILVIHLKRFASGSRYASKLNVMVDCNLNNLELSEFASNTCRSPFATYNLYGVVDHIGSVSAGHYTAKCKNPYTNEWNEFDDRTVTSASVHNIVTERAYLLFYEEAKGQGCSSRL